MKYKKMDLELPPLGEYLAVMDDDKSINLGFFYLRSEKRTFHSIFTFPLACGTLTGGWIISMIKPQKWAKIPKFKSLKKYKPPVGIEVLFCIIRNDGHKSFSNGISIKDMPIYTDNQDNTVDSWIEFEEFKEDKE